MEIKLTKNFTLDEMCRSTVARKKGIHNSPSVTAIKNLKALCENVLQPLRDRLGKPIVINSGYRSPLLNRLIGGANGSQHVKGEAADIRCESMAYAKEIVLIIMEHLVFDQLILETKGKAVWVHVSYRADGGNRQQALTIHKS